MGRQDEGSAWVVAAVQALNSNQSWTGRIHVHKLLFVVQALGLARPPFEFELYQYGPYSFGLDETIGGLEAFGFLTKAYPQPGYGPRYSPTDAGLHDAGSLGQSDAEAIERTARKLGSRSSKELELLATCLWVERYEHVKGDDAVLARVLEIKPKYSAQDAAPALRQARALAADLAA